jgi:hypothetical protein
MPFMVIYRTPDGSSCYEQADAIDEAALLVERLRNKEGLDEIRIYRMEEISFAFRPYYKVELGLKDRQSMPPPPSASSAVAVDGPAPEPGARAPVDASGPGPEVTVDRPRDVAFEVARPAPPAGTDDETASANGRRGLFGR